jgi:hypothetical protein
MEDDNSQAKVLDFGHDFGEVLVSARDERIGDRAALGKCHNVAPELAVDALATTRPGVQQAQLEPGHLGERVVFCGPPAVRGLVPVTPQYRQSGAVSRQSGEQFQESGVVPGDGIPTARAMNGHRAICEGIACINEQRTPIHPDTILS